MFQDSGFEIQDSRFRKQFVDYSTLAGFSNAEGN